MAGGNPYYQGPASDHFDGMRFFNPGQPTTDRTLAAVLRWKWSERAATWPRSVPVVASITDARVEGLRVTMVGHATLLIQAAGLNLLTDPVWSPRASPFARAGPARVTGPGIAFDSLPPIDVVLLSHNHYDHLDLATLGRLHAAHRPLMVMPLGNDAIVRAALPDARIAVGDWGDRIALGEHASTTLLRANHWSARWVRDRRMALWCGHVINTPAGRVYFAGDTGYGDGTIFRAIAGAHGAPDLALIPIGAYAPRWFMGSQHCAPDEAVRIFQEVGAARAVGIHWGTFPLTDEPRDEPPRLLNEALDAAGIERGRFVAGVPGGVY